MGTLTYTSLPDTLARELVESGAGVGLGIVVPPAWRSHAWSGAGTPTTVLARKLASDITQGLPLPSPADLSARPDLEASALKAMDWIAPARIAVLFHADDPLVLESSRGALQAAVNLIANWAKRKRAQFHVSPAKTVVMVAGSTAAQAIQDIAQGHRQEKRGRGSGRAAPRNDIRHCGLRRIARGGPQDGAGRGGGAVAGFPWRQQNRQTWSTMATLWLMLHVRPFCSWPRSSGGLARAILRPCHCKVA